MQNQVIGARYLLLLFGANGQLGKSIQQSFALENDGSMDLYPVSHIECDFEQLGAVAQFLKRIDNFVESKNYDSCIVLNAASYNNVEQAEEDIDKAYYINARAVDEMAREVYARSWGMIHISTDYVFNGEKRTPYTTSDVTSPISVYGGTKADGERAIKRYLSKGNGLLIRTSWLFSAYGKNFVKTMLQLATERQEIRVVEDQIGCPTYAPHLAKFVLHCVRSFMENGRFPQRVLHYTNVGVTSWYLFAKAIIAIAGMSKSCKVLPIKTSEYPTKAQRPAFSILECDASFGDFYSVEDALCVCLDQLRKTDPYLFEQKKV